MDHKLRIALSELPPGSLHLIKEALTIPNIERQKAMEQNIWGWQTMPESIPLYSVDSNSHELVLPRGFQGNLLNGLDAMGLAWKMIDLRVRAPIPYEIGHKVDLHPWQAPAVKAILDTYDGIYKAPAGSGKTVTVLEAIRRSNSRSIVLVNTKDIMWQWVERAKTFLGLDYPISMIGDGSFEISSHLTIATVQTLHRRFTSIEHDGFFDKFGFMCLDESHHATAETFNALVNRFSSRWRIGVSATPDKTGDFALATNVLGPVFHETKKSDVDSLIDPCVFRIPTGFAFRYRGAKGRNPSNYPQLLQALIADKERNELIADTICLEEGTHSLVISKRLEHLKTLEQLIIDKGYSYPIMRLTGKESSEDRQQVVYVASESPSVIFSTLADEALDIPRLDRLFLAFPQRNTGLITQQVGRICRKHPEKVSAHVYDFHDSQVGPLENQWRVRRREVYQPNRYKILTILPSDIERYMKEMQ